MGKTTACRMLTARFGLVHIETDLSLPPDVRLRPLDGPDSVWDGDAQELCGRLIHAAQAASPYLMKQALKLSETSGRWVLEGERVHPALAARLTTMGIACGVFIVETDARRIDATLRVRLPRFGALLERRQRAVAEVNRLYNLWLIDEAAHYEVACIESQPWETLADRLLKRSWQRATLPN